MSTAVAETDAPAPLDELQPCSVAFFRAMAGRLATEARRCGWTAPEFTTPPANPDQQRSLARDPHTGRARIAVRLDRPAGAVADDMIAGIVAINAGVAPTRRMTALEAECELWVAALDL